VIVATAAKVPDSQPDGPYNPGADKGNADLHAGAQGQRYGDDHRNREGQRPATANGGVNSYRDLRGTVTPLKSPPTIDASPTSRAPSPRECAPEVESTSRHHRRGRRPDS